MTKISSFYTNVGINTAMSFQNLKGYPSLINRHLSSGFDDGLRR